MTPEDTIEPVQEQPEAEPLPLTLSRHEYDRLLHFPGVTDAHRLWIADYVESGKIVIEGDEPLITD